MKIQRIVTAEGKTGVATRVDTIDTATIAFLTNIWGLDRDVVDFLLRVPNEQLVRPGRRRSLMRRALKGIVPEAVLERRRKGYLVRSPMHTIAVLAARIRELMATSQLVGRGLIDLGRFEKTLQEAECGVETQWAFALIRTCLLELWLHE